MNTGLVRIDGTVRTDGTVMDGWPILLACAAYAMAFYILAMTMASISLVA